MNLNVFPLCLYKRTPLIIWVTSLERQFLNKLVVSVGGLFLYRIVPAKVRCSVSV